MYPKYTPVQGDGASGAENGCPASPPDRASSRNLLAATPPQYRGASAPPENRYPLIQKAFRTL